MEEKKTTPVGTLKRLGEMLTEAGFITNEQLVEALEIQKQTKEKLGAILLRLGYITEEVLIAFLGKQLGIQFVLLEELEISPEICSLVPESIARRLKIMPIERHDKKLVVAMCDPFDVIALDDLKLLTGCQIEVLIATEKDIISAINKYYSTSTESSKIDHIIVEAEQENKELDIVTEGEEEIKEEIKETDAPIIKLVNTIISDAIEMRASDIHIEPYENDTRLRYRIDGVLHEQKSLPKKITGAIVSRVKVMSKLKLEEHRLPQDGRIKIRHKNKEVDLRISVLPTTFGEKVVMRILDTTALCLDLNKLGFEPETLEVYLRNVKRPHGIILVTGPTGSGKSTTLYSTLALLDHPDVNIVTIEDPVEYILHGVNQVQVNPAVGLTFAQGLRSFLRQDPDVIMVGEIRDTETAEIAINAALTGHLVFSTLHTNDAATGVTRLINMGIEPFLIASTVTMIVAQRLVRVICKNCREEYEVNVEDLRRYGINPDKFENKRIMLFRGRGCQHCNRTGYRGRTACFEVLEVTNEIRDLIVERASSNVIKEAAVRAGMLTLRQAALKKLLGGITTVEEILRVTASEETENV